MVTDIRPQLAVMKWERLGASCWRFAVRLIVTKLRFE
jgi:hypothetical protein